MRTTDSSIGFFAIQLYKWKYKAMIIFQLRKASVTIVMARFKLTFEAKNKHLASKKFTNKKSKNLAQQAFVWQKKV